MSAQFCWHVRLIFCEGKCLLEKGSRFAGLFGIKAGIWFLGPVFLQVWFAHALSAISSQGGLSSELFYGSRGLLAIVVALAFIALGYARKVTLFKVSWVFAGLLCLATWFLASGEHNEALLLLSIVCAGAGFTWCSMQYAYIYSFLDTKESVVYILLFFSIAALINIPLSTLPSQYVLIGTSVLPFVAMFFAAKALRNVKRETNTNEYAKSRADRVVSQKLLVVAVELAVYGVVVGLLRGFSATIREDAFFSLISSLLVVALCVSFYFFFVKTSHELDIVRLCQMVFFVLLTAVVVISFAQGAYPAIGMISSWCIRIGLIMLLWLVLVNLAGRSPLHPFVVFGVGWGVYMLAIMVGMIIGGLTDIASQQSAYFLNLAYLLVVSFLFALGIFKNRSMKLFASTSSSEHETQAKIDNPVSIDKACVELGEAHTFSKREIEILQHICKGRSKGYIASQIYVSENTVKYHAKQIYAKLGIHSRQELMSLIGIE